MEVLGPLSLGESVEKKPVDCRPCVLNVLSLPSGEMSEAARLDMELMNTRVDPVILKRTVNNHDAGRQARPRMSSRRSASPLYPIRRVRSPRSFAERKQLQDFSKKMFKISFLICNIS